MKTKSPKTLAASSKVRSALRLPRYVLRKRLRSGAVAYFFSIPGWARETGCLVKNEPLGIDYDAAVKRAETVLLPAFDSWRLDGATDNVEPSAKVGTLTGFSPSTGKIGVSKNSISGLDATTRLDSAWSASTS